MSKKTQSKITRIAPPKQFSIFLNKNDSSEKIYTPQHWYKSMADHMESGVWVADKNLDLVYANRALCELLDYSHEEIIGMNEFDLWNAKTIKTVKKIVATDRKQGVASSYEGGIISKTGEDIPIRSHGTPLPEGGTIVIVNDLRDAKKKEQEFIKSEKRFYNFANLLPQAVFEMDISGKLLFVNENAFKMFRYEKNFNKNNLNIYSLLNFKDKIRAIRVMRNLIKTKKNNVSEYNVIRKDGTVFPAQINISPITKDKKVIAIRGILVDITELKNAQKQIRISEQKYKELFDNMSSGVAVYNAVNNGMDFILINFNKAAEKIEKTKSSKVIGKSVIQIFPGVKQMGLLKAFQRVWKTGKPEHFPLTLYKDKRISGWRENYIYKLPTGEIVSVYDDVTERKQSEELMLQLKQAIEQSIDGMALADMNGMIQFMNSSWAKMHGYKSKELTNKHLNLFHTKDQMQNEVIPFNQKVIEKGANQGEIGHVKKDGTVFSTFMTTTLIKNANNQPIALVGTARDITKEKQAKQLLEQRVREFNVLYRAHSHLRMVNPLSKVLNDITRDIICAFQFHDITESEIIFDNKSCKSSNKKFSFIHTIEEPIIVGGIKRGLIRVGYTNNPPHISRSIFLPEERKLVKSIAYVLAKHIFSRETIERHKTIVRRSFTGIFITINGVICYLNPRFCKMFKIQEKGAIGKSISDFISSIHIDLKEDSVMGSNHYECEGMQTDGKIINLDIVIQNIDYHGKKAVLWCAHDITCLKKAEEKLKNFNIKLKQIVEEKTHHLELANKRLQSLNELKDEFIAVTSHELRSPLTSIRGYLSFLVEKESLECVPDSIQQYLLRAYHNAESLNHLVNNILDVSRLDMGRFELQTVKTDLIQLIKNIIDSLHFQTNERNLEIVLKNPSSLENLMLNIDPIRISQVLRNLLDNAIKYTSRDKKIIVEITKDWGFVIIKVIDQGFGIPKKQIEHIFDKFIQLKNADAKYKGGAGLGLFIARRIVQLHDGIIRADSKKNQGTTFTIKLPLSTNN